MKQVVLMLLCSFLINASHCFSQVETKIKHVFGYSDDINGVTMGISFGKIDTTYFVRCRISIPEKEYREMYLTSTSVLTFIGKSGNVIKCNLPGTSSSVEGDNQVNDRKIFFNQDASATILTFSVSKEQLAQISAEPFYRMTLPYFEKSSNSGELIFTRTALLTSKDFTEEGARFILGM